MGGMRMGIGKCVARKSLLALLSVSVCVHMNTMTEVSNA